MKTKTGLIIALTLTLGTAAAACGSDSASTDSASTTAAAATTAPAAPATTDPEAVTQRIVSLSPTHTEILFAIGAGDQLVAVDDQSNYPAEALELPNDLSGFEPNVEAIAGYEPDLVVIGGDFNGLADQLDAVGIESWDGPAASTLDDTYAQIEQLGAATGHIAEAAELVLSMQTRIDEIVADVPPFETPLSYYHELDSTYFSADSTTFIGQIYGLVGLTNIADADETESFGYPQLNAEVIIDANPDLIFLADSKCCDETAETVAARPGWDAIAAVQNGRIIEMDDDEASRWGPRVVDYLSAITAAVEGVAVPA